MKSRPSTRRRVVGLFASLLVSLVAAGERAHGQTRVEAAAVITGDRAGDPADRANDPGDRVQEAPPTGVLSLGEAVERALGHYPTLGVSRAAFAAARARHGQAQAAWWPELGLAGTLTRYQEPMIVSPIHDFAPGETPAFDETLIQGGGYLDWTLFDGGGRMADIRRTRREASAAEADLDATAQSLIADVSAAYLDVVSRTRVLLAHERRISALEAELDRVRQLREVGRAAEVEVLRVEAARASARADRVGVASALDVARRELARLMGTTSSEIERRNPAPVRIVGSSLPSREELVARAAEVNPGVEAARQRLRAAEAGLSLARSGRWPDLEIFGRWIDHAGIDSDHQLEWAAGLQFSLPVFAGGRIEEGVARAGAEAHGAAERLRLAISETDRAVDRAVSRAEETAARVQSLEMALARSREVARIEKLRLETGTGTQTDYLDAEADLLAVEASLAEGRQASVVARVELARVLGRLGADWIERNLEMQP